MDLSLRRGAEYSLNGSWFVFVFPYLHILVLSCPIIYSQIPILNMTAPDLMLSPEPLHCTMSDARRPEPVQEGLALGWMHPTLHSESCNIGLTSIILNPKLNVDWALGVLLGPRSRTLCRTRENVEWKDSLLPQGSNIGHQKPPATSKDKAPHTCAGSGQRGLKVLTSTMFRPALGQFLTTLPQRKRPGRRGKQAHHQGNAEAKKRRS